MKEIPDFVYCIILVIMIVIACGLIGFRIYALTIYANTPITEIPTWVYFLMKGNN